MFWSFLGGAADSLRNDLTLRKASEQEWDIYEKRIRLQEELRKEAESMKERSALTAQGIDLNRGVLYEQTRGGDYREFPLPQQYVEQQKSANALAQEEARIKREREERKFQNQLSKDEAAAESSRAAAANQRSQIESRNRRIEGQIDLDRARAEQARRPRESEDTTAKQTEREITAAFNALSKSQNPMISQAAQRIRFSNLSPEDKLAALSELANATE